MWIRRSETVLPLTALTAVMVNFKWTDVTQKAADTMKQVMACETLLAYSDYSKEFHIYTDASKIQLAAVISEEGRPIVFYSRKLNPAQTRYKTTERELLSLLEVPKEFRNIILGQQIVVHIYQKNVT